MANFCRWCAGLCGMIVIAAAVAGGVFYLYLVHKRDNGGSENLPFNATVIPTLTANNDSNHINTNLTNTKQGIHGWAALPQFEKNCSYYWAGQDKEGTPVWFFDYSNCLIAEVLNQELQSSFENYISQMIFRVNCSMAMSGKNDWALVSDMGGDLKIGGNALYVHSLFRKFKCFSNKMKYGLIFDSDQSAFAQMALTAIRWIIPAAADRTVFLSKSTPKSEVESEVSKRISSNQLPPKYGGVEGFRARVSYEDVKSLDCPDVPDFTDKLNECKT